LEGSISALKILKPAYILILILVGCAGVQSGKYVKFETDDTIDGIASKHSISKETLVAANSDRPLRPGQWIFIPKRRGILSASNKFRQAYSSNSELDMRMIGNLMWPVPSSKKVSSNFGHRWGRKHEGIDIPAREGAPILAVQDGVVVYAGNGLGGYGNLIVLGHKNGLFSVYAHAQKVFVRKNDRISQGQMIASVGQTGKASGPHLHFELRQHSRAINPMQSLVRN
jgi:murein DD-endopeptidase MepM/ murein hydrolase activator NlpD